MTPKGFEGWINLKISEAHKEEPKEAGKGRNYWDGRITAMESVKAKLRIVEPESQISHTMDENYPGVECGLSEDEWVLECLVDAIAGAEGTLIAMGKLRHLLEFCNIDTNSITAEFLKGYTRRLNKSK